MGGPVQAISLINQKQWHLVMVGTNIILSFGNKYVKLAWEFTGKPLQEWWDFLTFEEIWNDSKDKKIVYILKSSVSWKVSSEK